MSATATIDESQRDDDQTRQQQEQQSPSSSSSPRTPPFRSSFLSWVPTDEKQLYDCEATINAPLYKIGFEQYHVTGLNTITLRASTRPYDGTVAKLQQTKEFYEKFEKKTSWFGGFFSSSSSTSSSSSSNSCSASGGGSSITASSHVSRVMGRLQPITVKPKLVEQQQQANTRKNRSSPSSTKSPLVAPENDDNDESATIQKATIPVSLRHVVFAHGFAGGICNWLPNLKPLGELVNQQNQTRLQNAINKATTANDNNKNSKNEPVQLTILHAIDLPGFARSKRDENLTFGGPENVLRYYSWSFEEWFKHNQVSANASECNTAKWLRMEDIIEDVPENVEIEFVPAATAPTINPHHVTYVGHSFGAFLGAHYAIRYPTRIQHLVLTDPFGVQQYDPEKHALSTSKIPWKFRTAAKIMLSVFESALTPALRGLGPWAPDFISRMRPDFLERWKGLVEDPKIILDYIYHCNAQKCNMGDHAMAKTVQPDSRAVAALPLKPVLPTQLDKAIKLSIVYGSDTWMDKKAGDEMFEERKEFLKKNYPEFAHKSTGLLDHLHNAGHQVNSDQPELYNEYAIKVLGLKEKK